MANKAIHIHIGLEKTGTTSLQKFLRKNESRLASDGIIIPSRKYGLRFDLISDFFIDNQNVCTLGVVECNDSAIEEVKFLLNKNNDIVIVNELLSSRLISKESISRLKGFLDSFNKNIYIYIYFRETEGFIRSSYQECVKDTENDSFEDFVNKSFNSEHRYKYLWSRNRYDYLEIYNRWSSIFSNVTCVSMPELSSKRSALYVDFLERVGVKEIRTYDTNIKAKNEKLTNKQEFFFRKIGFIFLLFMKNKKKSSFSWKIGNLIKKISIKFARNMIGGEYVNYHLPKNHKINKLIEKNINFLKSLK